MTTMKQKIMVLYLSLTFISYSFGVKIPLKTEENDDYEPMGYACWKNNVSLNKYSNFKTSAIFETSYFETEYLSIATITSIDKKTRISSNLLAGGFVFSVAFAGMEKNFFYGCLLVFGAPIILGNAKVYVPVFKDNFRVGGGLNTDYYIFYRNSVIYSEGLLGFKINTSKIKIFADYRYPINGSYIENKKPYLNIGIALFQTVIDPD